MSTSRIRLVAVTGATLALVLAGTSIVTAHPGRDDGPPFGRGRDQPFGGGPGGFRGDFGPRAGLGLGDALASDLVRRETTWETDDGLVTHRLDAGTVSAVREGSLEYSLLTDETASVAVDEDTQVIGFSQQTVEPRGGWSRERWVGQELELEDLSADSEVIVWAESQDDGSFLAQRIVVRPEAEVTDDATTDDEPASDLPGTTVDEEASPAAAA